MWLSEFYTVAKPILMFVPYFSVFNILSHTPEEEIPDSYDKCERAFKNEQKSSPPL